MNIFNGGSMPAMWTPMCGQTWASAAASFVGTWTVMMIAMMLPSFAPTLWRYRHTLVTKARGRAALLTMLVFVGYCAVWAALGFGVFVSAAAWAALALRMPLSMRAGPMAVSVAVLLAGALQCTSWKLRYLTCCRVALKADDASNVCASGAVRHGLRLGLHCNCCCAAFTAALIATGTMNILAMTLLTAAITLERFAPHGDRVARAIGGVMGATGLWMMLRAA